MPTEAVVALAIIFMGCSFVSLWIWMGTRGLKRPTLEPVREGLFALEQRLARLEVAVDDMSAAFAQVTEGQQFLTKLLAERSASASTHLRQTGTPPDRGQTA
jgi:hypothetical protein